ncbi:unnamed protein product, partial [Closterium sp. NIES-65]
AEAPAEVPSQSGGILKVPHSSYEFGANVLDAKKMLIGRMADGRLSARVSYQVTDSVALKVNAQIVNEPHFSQGMFQLDYKEAFWLGHQRRSGLGIAGRYNTDKVVSCSCWRVQQCMCCTACALPLLLCPGQIMPIPHRSDPCRPASPQSMPSHSPQVATAQVASTGVVSMTYVQRVL